MDPGRQRDAHVAPPRTLILVVMCVGYFLVLLDVTVINVALPRIGAGLGSGVAGLQWVVDGYAVALAALLLGSGAVGDLLGHKRVVLLGLTVFGVASLACGLAPTTGVLIATRAVQGVGAALLLPGTLAIISEIFPDTAERARAIGVWAAVGGMALPAGPLLGGVLVSSLGWRWVFLLNVPIVVVAGLVAARATPATVPRRQGTVDRPGVVLGALALGAATFAVIEAGHAGATAAVIPAAVAVLAVALLIRAESRGTDPMLPPGLFRSRSFSTANAVAGAMNFGSIGLLFELTLFLQAVQHRSAQEAGVAVLPLFLPLSLLSLSAGRVTARLGPKPVMMAGLALAAVGTGLIATWQANSPYVALVPAMLLWGAGLGILTPAVVAAAVSSAPPDRAGLASGVNNTARQAGGAIGIAAFGAIAGSPAAVGPFLHGLHVTGLATAALYVASALAAALFIRR